MEITSQSKQEFTVVLKLSEDEARALHDITAYGYDAFIKVFKDKLGESYIKKHENGAKSLFEIVQRGMPAIFSRMDKARNVFLASEPNVVAPIEYKPEKIKRAKYILAFLLDKIGLTFKTTQHDQNKQ